jgi:peptidoglycan/LPS O-acetylase OafA/YrhL
MKTRIYLSRNFILQTSDSFRIRGFDGLRALAFVLVFVSHKASSFFSDRYGTLGVWIFFTLSGFLITRILAETRRDFEGGRINFKSGLYRFYIRRTARIFPVYYAFLVAVTILGACNILEVGSSARQASHWLYLSNVYIELNGWETRLGHLWSLAVEEQFYLVFCPLVLAVPLRRLPFVCVAILVVSVAAHGYFFERDREDIGFAVNSLVNFSLMAIGGLAGVWADKPLPNALKGDLALSVTLLFVLSTPLLFRWPDTWDQLGRLSGIPCALLLMQIYQSQNGRVVTLLDLRPVRELGVISYAAYLFHPVINLSQVPHYYGYPIEIRRSASMVMDFMATILLATLSWRLLERPVRNWVISKFHAQRDAIVHSRKD